MNDIRRVLSYNDISLVPRFSAKRHLSDADLLYNYDKLPIPFNAIPLINAPMDKVCSPELLNLLYTKFNMPVTIHRWFNSAEEQIAFLEKCEFKRDVKKNRSETHARVFLSVGSLQKWKKWIDVLNRQWARFNFGILVDVANGDTLTCVETVEYIRRKIPYCNIMAGNVATRSGYLRLEEAGANVIRCGIGGGCFVPWMMVRTSDGMKKICDVKNGDFVFTHRGIIKEVIATLKYGISEYICEIYKEDGDKVSCTKNHEFYVVNIKYKDVVTEENIHRYAEWIAADKLSDEYFLVEQEGNPNDSLE